MDESHQTQQVPIFVIAMELCHTPYMFKRLEYIHKWLQHNFAKVTCRTCDENLILLDELRYGLRFFHALLIDPLISSCLVTTSNQRNSLKDRITTLVNELVTRLTHYHPFYFLPVLSLYLTITCIYIPSWITFVNFQVCIPTKLQLYQPCVPLAVTRQIQFCNFRVYGDGQQVKTESKACIIGFYNNAK